MQESAQRVPKRGFMLRCVRQVEGTIQGSGDHKGHQHQRAYFPGNSVPHCPQKENPFKDKKAVSSLSSLAKASPASARSEFQDG